MTHKGLRYNQGKPRLDLQTPFATTEEARVLTVGANKYAERNWERGMPWTTVLASLKRHITKFEQGEDFDAETGLYHMAHAMCNCRFLLEYYRIYPQGDDRPKKFLSIPKIGLDIDEVLADWVGAYMQKFGLEHRPTAWNFMTDPKGDFEQMDEDFWMSIEPKVRPEHLSFEPHCYITSRPISSEVTAWWLEHHGFPTVDVYTVGKGVSKVDVARDSGIEVFVDDSFDNFVQLNNAGILCFLFDAPHNRRYDVGHLRIQSLNDLPYFK